MSKFTLDSIIFARSAFTVAPVWAPPLPGPGVVSGTSGDDLIDTLYTGDPEGDVIGAGDDAVLAGAGNDTVRGEEGNDEIYGGTGDDYLKGLEGDDELHGEDGDDFLIGGDGADTIVGGSGNDYIYGGNAGDVVDGSTEGSDYDTLDLSENGPLRIVGQTTDADGDSTSGTVEFLDELGNVTGTMTFAEIENLILPVDNDPVAVDDTATTDEDTVVTIDVLGNDTDPNGDPLTVVGTPTAPNGTVTVNGDGTLEYTPDPDFNGVDTITYVISDGNGGTDTADVTVTVNPINDGPVAVDDAASTGEGTLVNIDVLGNDTDVDGDTLTVTGTPTAANGTVTVLADGTLDYTPDAGFIGEDTITYVISDGNGGTDTADVLVTVGAVNAAPVATPDTATTDEDTAVTVDVLSNDTDPDSDPLSILGVPTADNGTVTVNGDGTLEYTPDPDFNGVDTITYVVSDGNGGTDIGEASITVNPINDAPVANDDTVTTDEDTPVAIGVLDNDTDPESDPLTIVGTPTASNGTVTVNGSGELVYTPNPDFNGVDTITYEITDGNGGTDTADVTVTVNPLNDAPVANDDAATTPFDTPVVIDVLANDTDPESDPLTIVGTPTSADGTVAVLSDGTIEFTPTPGFEGLATIDYEITDGNGGSDTAVVSVTVEADPLDGIVQGTAGDDLIDVTYTGDPQGDMIDNDDAILPGEAPQDDIVLAGDGDDTIISGEGSDDVTGGAGDDLIDTSNGAPANDHVTFLGVPVDGDPEDDRDSVDGGDGNDTITTGDDADTIIGGLGDDSIMSGIDDDSIIAGDGNDYIDASLGNDYVEGGAGDDTIHAGFGGVHFSDYLGDDPNLPGVGLLNPDGTPALFDPNTADGRDTIYGDDGNDLITTGDDADVIYGGADNDTIDAGIDDDYVEGGTGDDSITGGHGSDTIYGNDGDDYIDASSSTLLFPNEPDATDPVPENDRDFVDGGVGNDTILGGDDADTLFGGAGDDVIDGGIDEDSIDGGDGNDVIDGGSEDDILRGRLGDDTVTGGHGNDTITGGFGDDVLMGGDDSDGYPDILDATDPEPDNDRDHLDGRQGDDTIYGGDDDDTLLGGTGNDFLDGGIDEDSIHGGAGDDTIIGGQGADTMFGEGGQDLFTNVNAGDVIDGGGNPGGTHANGLPNDYDTLDLTGSAPAGGHLEVTYTSADQEDGIVEYFDAANVSTGTLVFTEIENIIPCFTPGTVIATPLGERLVEDLREGDRIITRDNGIQEIRWKGAKLLTGQELMQNAHLKPVLIQAGSLGNGLPERDMLVSPNHRILVSNDKTALYFEEREVLAAAKHLTGMKGVDTVDTSGTTYIHFMFDQHEVVLSNGAWTESFQPGDQTLKGLDNAQRSEIFELFPELQNVTGIEAYQAARRSLKKHEAKLLAK